MTERAAKAIIAASVLGVAVVAVSLTAWLRDRDPPAPRPVATTLAPEPRPGENRAPQPRTGTARSRRPAQGGKPVGQPQAMPPANPVYAATEPSERPPPLPEQVVHRPEEVAVRRVLEPLLARRPNTELSFVRCLDPGGWKQGSTAEEGASDDPLDVPSRDPDVAVCRARVRARDRGVLLETLKDASGAYKGHVAATDVREHLDAYLGRWFETDVQVDTEEAYPVPDP